MAETMIRADRMIKTDSPSVEKMSMLNSDGCQWNNLPVPISRSPYPVGEAAVAETMLEDFSSKIGSKAASWGQE